MAIEYDISGLLGKTENEGSTEAGRLTSSEWNTLVSAVQEVQNKSEGAIKGIKYNGGAEAGGQTFSEIDEDGYLKMTVADSSGYQLTTYIDNPPAYIARGSECILKIRVSSKQVQGDDLIPATAACSVNLYLNGAPTPFYTGNVYDIDSTTPGVVKELVIDIAKISGISLLTGELDNEIKIEINNRFGKITQSYCYVKVVELGLSVDLFGTKTVFTENDKPQLIARVSGTNGTVSAWVDGTKILPTDTQSGEALNGVDTNFGQDIFNNVNTHGVHTIEVIASVVRQTGEDESITISTLPQKFNYIYGTTNTRPVVMSVINNTTPEEYSNFEMSYVAYKYNATAAAVTDTVNVSLCDISYDDDNKPVVGKSYITVSQDITFDPTTNSGTGKAMFSLFPVDNVSLVGKKAIVISIGDFSQIAEIEVLKSSVTLSQLSGYAVYLTANNRSNNEPADTVRTWRSVGKDRTGKELIVNAIFDENIEFIDTGSGWIADDDKNMALHLRKGRFFTLDYCPFDENPTYNDNTNRGNGRGKTISMEFATRNCLNQNSKVIECLDSSNGQERGFVVTASSATLKANTFDLGIEFKEDTRIRIDFVIEGKQTTYDYDTVSGKDGIAYKGSSNEALAIVYVDGVYQGLKVIPTATSFLQGNSSSDPSKIRFGSNDCDLDIYSIRIYDQALTPMQIVNNYSYDTPNFADKIAIAKRNNIFDETSAIANKPNINIEKLRIARPELPFFYVKQPLNADGNDDALLPQDKSNWLKVPLTEWKNPANENDPGEAAVSFTSTKGRWRNQGTSSMSYPWPWRNWDWQAKFDDGETGFTFGDGTTGEKWQQYKGMSRAGNIKKITLKKDYASSEMCNNAITSEYFTDMALAIGNDFPNVLSPAQRIDGADTTPYRLTFVATPCFLFQQFNDPTKNGTAGAGYEALGMMNLIPNKNECDHLGFGKSSGYAWGEKGTKFDRAQSWELADNKDGWFWYKKLEGIQRNPDGTFTNDLEECYEARYPKDTTTFKDDKGEFDGDFGLVPEGKTTMTADEAADLANEQADIIEFHNWLVDCNRQICEDYKKTNGEYRELTPTERDWDWNKNTDGSYNKYDTPEYRLNKFKAEAPTRLIVDQFCLYYIWRETFWAFDSGFKNLQVYTMGKANEDSAYCQWGCMVRDADTTLGIDNLGVKKFPAHLEDTDFMIEAADGTRTFNYDGAKGMYHAQSIADAGGLPVLNGQLGSLWINLRDAFGENIGKIYRALANSTKGNWNGSRAIKRFRDHQEKWSENLYNFGMRQYFGGEPFTTWIASGLGDKKNSRASWLDRGFYYRNSKYNNLGDYCKVRACCYSTPDNIEGVENEITSKVPLKFKAYIPMYIGLGASTETMSACKNYMRITDVDNTFDVVPGPDGLNFPLSEAADENTWFYGTSQLTEIGDLARGCKIKEFASITLPKLRELNLGHEKDRDGIEYNEYYVEDDVKKVRPFTNRYLKAMNCSTLKQLTLLDVTNHVMLNAINGLNGCDQLQELYARGTDALTGVDLPATTALRVIYLGKNLVTLNLTDLTSIEKFELEGADAITQLYIRNCGSYMAERSYDIMTMAIASLERVYDPKTNNNICHLTDVNWVNADSSYLERLLNIQATLSGYIKVGALSNDLKVRLIAAYGDIDNPNNSLYIEYTQREITSAKLPSKMYYHIPGKYQLKFTVTPPAANTYASAKWEIASNPYAGFVNETDAANGVLTRYEGTANQQTSAKLTVTIKQLPYSNGDPRQDIVLTSTVYFYERLAKPGDYVFQDGTYSDELDDSKTPIGVCFYVDPVNANNRLMMALESVQYSAYSMPYGLGTGGNNLDGSNNITGYFGSPQGIVIEGEEDYDCYDIAALPNYTIPGVTIEKGTNYFDDSIYRDANNADNGYFKSFESQSMFGDLGWKRVEKRIYIDRLTNKDGTTSSIVVNVGDIEPTGYYNTMAIIEHRNKVLDSYANEADREFIRPYADAYTSELASLRTLGSKADTLEIGGRIPSIANTAGSHLYYPAASCCFAYEPNAAGLLDKFKVHNWFLPSSGELLRMCYYAYQSYKDNTAQAEPVNSIYDSSYNEPANAFYIPIKDAKLKMGNFYGGNAESGTTMWSSTETGSGGESRHAVAISSNNGTPEQRSKSSSGSVRPVCKF